MHTRTRVTHHSQFVCIQHWVWWFSKQLQHTSQFLHDKRGHKISPKDQQNSVKPQHNCDSHSLQHVSAINVPQFLCKNMEIQWQVLQVTKNCQWFFKLKTQSAIGTPPPMSFDLVWCMDRAADENEALGLVIKQCVVHWLGFSFVSVSMMTAASAIWVVLVCAPMKKCDTEHLLKVLSANWWKLHCVLSCTKCVDSHGCWKHSFTETETLFLVIVRHTIRGCCRYGRRMYECNKSTKPLALVFVAVSFGNQSFENKSYVV